MQCVISYSIATSLFSSCGLAPALSVPVGLLNRKLHSQSMRALSDYILECEICNSIDAHRVRGTIIIAHYTLGAQEIGINSVGTGCIQTAFAECSGPYRVLHLRCVIYKQVGTNH